jgi:hypothetical protein
MKSPQDLIQRYKFVLSIHEKKGGWEKGSFFLGNYYDSLYKV